MVFRCVALGLVFFILTLANAGLAQNTSTTLYQRLPVANLAPMLRNARNTSFNPATHGLPFHNGFTNNFVSEFDISTGGLCGGMSYTALDYYFAGKAVPTWAFMPAEHKPLRKYIYDRQINSLADNIDKWAEVTINPFGSRNWEFFKWGLDGRPGGRLHELKTAIDAGRPVPLGLRSCDENCFGDHQVVAIGYDFGRYNGNVDDRYSEDVKIKIYDPNSPRQTLTLIPDWKTGRFVYAEDATSATNPRKGWRT